MTVYLAVQTSTSGNSGPSKSVEIASKSGETFLSAKERKDQRKAAMTASTVSTKNMGKVYLRKDVMVGDTVRIVGRVNEFPRKRAGGVLEWFREVVVDEGSGGSIGKCLHCSRNGHLCAHLTAVVVDEEEGYDHIDLVRALHRDVYSQPFQIPLPLASSSFHANTSGNYNATFSTLSSPPQTLSDLPSSECSETDMQVGHLNLRDPAKLRPSQLTDSTYRQYVLDYMTQQTIRALGSDHQALGVFPEFAEYLAELQSGSTRSTRSQRYARKDNVIDDSSDQSMSCDEELHPFTLPDILDVPHLHQLALLVVDAVARKEEKRRRRRIVEGVPRPGDVEVDVERKKTGRDWRLTSQERSSRMSRLTAYIIRGLASDGAIVHLHDGYLPLPPDVVFPLLAPHFEREAFLRKGVYMRKSDPRYGNGVTAAELVVRLRGWGADGRWERINEWVIQDAIAWGEGRGLVRKQGVGWWLVDGG